MRRRRLLARAVLWALATVGFFSTVFSFCSVSHIEEYDRARVSVARARLVNLEAVLELYRMDLGRYPTTDEGLRALVCGPSGVPVPIAFPTSGYLRIDAFQDPWANPFQYRSP